MRQSVILTLTVLLRVPDLITWANLINWLDLQERHINLSSSFPECAFFVSHWRHGYLVIFLLRLTKVSVAGSKESEVLVESENKANLVLFYKCILIVQRDLTEIFSQINITYYDIKNLYYSFLFPFPILK